MTEGRILEPARGARPRIVVVVGPTASGKSALAAALAKRVDGEVVSADSMQVYRHMDIGTAKSSADERARVPHHLIDLVSPDEPFNVAQYKERADAVLRDIHARGKHAIVAGGTGLYVKVLVHGIFPAPKVDTELRKRLAREAEVYGADYLHAQLALIDKAAADRIAPTDLVRIIRALEVHEQTGIPLSEHQLAHSFHGLDYEAKYLGIDYPRETLYRRVEARVDKMIEMGLVDEVRGLLERGYGPALKPMQALGYKQIAEHVLEHVSLADAVRRTKRETKRYAKRQLTWFRNDPVEWVLPQGDDLGPLAELCRAFLRREELRS